MSQEASLAGRKSPWIIMDRLSDITYQVHDIIGCREQLVHINRLKPTAENGVSDEAVVVVVTPERSKWGGERVECARNAKTEWEADYRDTLKLETVDEEEMGRSNVERVDGESEVVEAAPEPESVAITAQGGRKYGLRPRGQIDCGLLQKKRRTH
ncbi:hypothetical protein GE061_016276 [Apolygus lucorum]|uniref:Integrase p58-like C-terminal domain-containing protein n=1 Tax=Apolygus lucorum TaxID=248454 RepID=A0A8S9XFR5_APOLU|nr:hypothetical protein GE061_016276 [Apolygus lucorum]